MIYFIEEYIHCSEKKVAPFIKHIKIAMTTYLIISSSLHENKYLIL
jgi:hypothetical protein